MNAESSEVLRTWSALSSCAKMRRSHSTINICFAQLHEYGKGDYVPSLQLKRHVASIESQLV